MLLDSAPGPAGPRGQAVPPTGKRRLTRRASVLGAAVLGAAAITAAITAGVIVAVLHGHTTAVGPAANQGTAQPAGASALPVYPGQQARGVFQTIDRIVASGNTMVTTGAQQAGGTAGHIQPVALSAIAGGLIPEQSVPGTAVAGGAQIAVGSADGYPAVWRRVSGGAWTLVSSLAQVSADPDFGGLSTITHGPNGWLAAGPGGRGDRGDRHRHGPDPGEPAVHRPEPSWALTAAPCTRADTVGTTKDCPVPACLSAATILREENLVGSHASPA